MSIEVVINNKYGEFGLSIKALMKMAELGNKEAIMEIKNYDQPPVIIFLIINFIIKGIIQYWFRL